MNIPGYDAWKLASPYDDLTDAVGEHEGETCNRVEEPDEDAPRGYRPRPCTGTMYKDFAGYIECNTCEELA